jgi:3-dehydroquinate dehydratase-2
MTGESQCTPPAAGMVCVINGPNLNLLGTRETHIYGTETLAEIEIRCRKAGMSCGLNVNFMQSNHEGQIIDWIQEAVSEADAIVINAAAYTHTSVAIHDALLIFPGYKVELHISNPHVREPFRHVSYVATAVDAVVAGLGTCAYELTISLIAQKLRERDLNCVREHSL